MFFAHSRPWVSKMTTVKGREGKEEERKGKGKERQGKGREGKARQGNGRQGKAGGKERNRSFSSPGLAAQVCILPTTKLIV